MEETNKNRCICISCFDFYETRMEDIISFFQNKGYEVSYVISDYQHYKKAYFKAEYKNCRQLHVPSYKNNLSLSRLISHFVFSKEVYNVLCEERPSLVYSQFPPNYLTKVLYKYKSKYDAKIILDCYDMWPESFPKKKMAFGLTPLFKYWASIRDKHIGCADMVLVVSQAHLDVVKNKWKNQIIKILKPSVKAHPLTINDKMEDSLSFCYLGNVNYITDVDLIIKTLTAIRRERRVILHIIGKGDNLPILINGLKEAGVETICHGVVFDTEEKYSIYSRCSYGINMPRKEINSTMSLKSVEYLSVGLPFINSAGGDTHDFVNTNNIGINIDPQNISEGIIHLLKIDGEELKTMHHNCIKLYEMKFMSSNLDDTFNGVL